MTARRVKLLVSVRSAEEASAALEGGADIIDVKEPSRGPLGMADVSVIGEVVDAVRGRRPVSAALGELREDNDASRLPRGLAFVKVGLSRANPATWRRELAARFAEVAGTEPVAVIYHRAATAQSPPASEVLRWAIENKAAGVLVDTFDKRAPGTLASDDADESVQLEALIRDAKSHGLFFALAGSLRGESFARALALEPDILGVRGAACAGNDRLARIDTPHVRGLANLIAAHNAQAAQPVG